MEETAAICLNLLTARPLTNADEINRWNELVKQHHYLGSHHMIGEQIRYVIEHLGQWVALVGWSSAALKLTAREEWIGWTVPQCRQRLHLVAQNARFLILPGYATPNLASKSLGLTTRRLSNDWNDTYGHPILLAETFVEERKNEGTCYKASGWQEIGATKGFQRTRDGYRKHGITKRLFVKPLEKQACNKLCSSKPLSWDRPLETLALSDQPILEDTQAAQPGLFAIIEQHITDPRSRRGRSYRAECLIGLILTGMLAGQKNCAEITKWAQELKQHERKKLRCPMKKKAYVVPSANTLRYFLQDLDPQELNEAACAWVRACGISTDRTHIAIDGKILCGSGSLCDDAQGQITASEVNREISLGQESYNRGRGEVTAGRALIKDLDLQDAIVTTDAGHTNRTTAMHIAEKGGSTCSPLKETRVTFSRPPRASSENSHRNK